MGCHAKSLDGMSYTIYRWDVMYNLERDVMHYILMECHEQSLDKMACQAQSRDGRS